MATTRKGTARGAGSGKKPAPKRRPAQKNDIDRRWSILLFGLGLFIVLLAVVPGENGWAWLRGWVLFGAFGAGGWLLGAMVVWWAVLVSLERPVFPAVIKGVLFLFALSGAALVFGGWQFGEPGFAELLNSLILSGQSAVFGGGLISLLFGYTLLALCGAPAARILLVLLVVVAVMVLTGVTPGDIARFFRRVADKTADRMDEAARWDGEPEPAPAPEPAARRFSVVDVPLGHETRARAAGAQGARPSARRSAHDIPLDAPPVQSEAGGADHVRADIGPGGTFGVRPARAAAGAAAQGGGTEPDHAFSPPVPRPLPPPPNGERLLFGEEDPLFSLGGERSRLPRGLTLDVEYLPPADDPEFDLFGNPGAPHGAPADSGGARPAPAAQGAQPARPEQPTVDALIEKAARQKAGAAPAAQPERAGGGAPYRFPQLEQFDPAPAENTVGVREEMKKTAELLVSTLASFGVQTRILDVSRGPSVTRYEVQPQAGVKISRITNLADDIALNLAAAGVRIEAPIPGKPAVGIEVPNRTKSTVSIRSILQSDAFAKSSSPLTIALGKDIAGEAVVADLTRMPHLLIAGSTGSGKSVCVNSVIMSFLYKSSPEDVKMILIDPKVVELAEYNGIPHLLIPVVTEPRQAAKALGHAVAMMEQRYRLFAEVGARDIKSFNALARRDSSMEKMPHIAIFIDELADLMMVAGKDVENFICRIAQKARAAGMHLIVATQRPSVDVITGLIKANIPSRIAFAVSSQVDSRTILDGAGAEKLLGMGDMLFMPIGANKPVRVQGTYVKDREISRVLEFVKQSAAAEYDESVLAEMEKIALSGAAGAADAEGEGDEGDLLADSTFVSAVETALENGTISTSFLQRRLRLGYARAGRIMDQMERMGIISQPEGSKPRQVCITRQQWQEMVMNRPG